MKKKLHHRKAKAKRRKPLAPAKIKSTRSRYVKSRSLVEMQNPLLDYPIEDRRADRITIGDPLADLAALAGMVGAVTGSIVLQRSNLIEDKHKTIEGKALKPEEDRGNDD